MKFILYPLMILKQCAMEWLSLYSKYFFKLGISLKTMTSSPGTGITAGTVVAASAMTDTEKAIYLLICFYVLDFITGILASWKEKKEAEKKNPKLKEQSLISSEKLKLSGVKAFTYASAILAVWGIEKVFIIKSFKFDSFSDQDMTITLIFIGFCCSVEFYSIFFENFKRAGFDIRKKFFAVAGEVKKIINKITT
jgi:phage-related holin